MKTVALEDLPTIYQKDFDPRAIKVDFTRSENDGKIVKRSYSYDSLPISSKFVAPLGVPMSYIESCKDSKLVESIIQERASTISNDRLCIVSTGDRVHDLTVRKRELIQPVDLYSEVAGQMDTLGWFPAPPRIEFDDRSLELNLVAHCNEIFERPVTPKQGDILRSGFRVRLLPGRLVSVLLEIIRLICLNGMTANEKPYSWKDTGTAESQLLFVSRTIPKAVGSLMGVVAKAELMSKEEVKDPLSIIRSHAKAMGLPEELVPFIMQAFEQEPENTLYGVWNSFTRAATHDERVRSHSREIAFSSGEFITNFDMVNARLPKQVALSIGASILN
jgi:hypothetical protein